MVSATDRDIKPVVNAIANIAAGCVLEIALKDDAEQLEAKLIEAERRTKVISCLLYSEMGSDDDTAKMGFITLCFGYDSLLQRKDFVQVIMSKRCNWILDDHLLRERLATFNDDTLLEEFDAM